MAKPPTPTAKEVEKGDWEKDFFEKHKITDEAEKNAIRSRARVLAYDRASTKAEQQESTSDDDKPKKWYE